MPSIPAVRIVPAWVSLMPKPSPLGRAIRRLRIARALTQDELSDLTERYGCRVPQNTISRIESGRSQRINETDRLETLAKVLGAESDVDFILAAYAPDGTYQRHVSATTSVEYFPPGPKGEIVALVQAHSDQDAERALHILRIVFDDKPEDVEESAGA